MRNRLLAPRRRPLQLVLWSVAALIGLQLVFFVLLVAAAAVPDRPIVDNLAKGVSAGLYGPAGAKDRMGGQSDSFTECVAVGTGIGEDARNAVTKAGVMPRLASCSDGAKQVRAMASGDQEIKVGHYFRYWAGYTVVTRPTLAVFGMPGMRIVAGGLLVGAVLLTASTFSRRVDRWSAAAVLTPLVLATNLMSTPSTSFSQALSIATYLVGSAFCLSAARRSSWAALLAAGLAAAVFCFVDLLTTPAIAWSLAAAAVGCGTWLRTASARTTLSLTLFSGVVWPVVFAFTWMSRWLIAVPFVGWRTMTDDVKTQILFRVDGENSNVRNEVGAAFTKNLHYWLDHVATARAFIGIALLVLVTRLIVVATRRLLHVFLILAAPALVIPLWYELLRNHSQIHVLFTYRGLPVALGIAVLAALVAGKRDASSGPELATSQRPTEAEGHSETAASLARS